jgi:hypothetical protein
MTRMKLTFAALLTAAIVSVVPRAHAATTVKVVIAGSSAMWQSMALAAYKGGACVTGGTKPCFHYTAKNFNLADTRPATKGGATVVDTGTIWIVWDSNKTSTNVWVYIKVDSVVGTRCYFAQPHCNINISTFPAPSNQISSTLWGDNSSDSTPPAGVSGLFTAGNLLVNTAATDIRPEDGLFAECRANSALGGGNDGLAGLGYNAANASGTCPSFGASLAQLQGSDILSGSPGSTATAHPLAFNISGTDPFTNTAIPTPTTVSVGAAPIVFIASRLGAMKTVTNATDPELESVFSGTNCDSNAFGAGGTIQAFLREPLSGTMNTTEYTVFRYPNVDGKSQETGVGATNPLAGLPCTSGGKRYRGIGTGEVVGLVQNSNADFSTDGIAYTFFSYGNVSAISNNANYGYLQLNGVDGIFNSYAGGDPGEPGNGTLPAAANLPSTCAGAFPCPESKIWTGGLSFPNLRTGTYRAWSILRIVSNGPALNNAKLLVSGAQTFAVNSVPDFVPFLKNGTDPGLRLLRSHYGPGAVNLGSHEAGRDEGGCIEKAGVTKTQQVQDAPGTKCQTFKP